jgi:uncharacterized protein YutE (UPF0331/DUF86 family)
MLLEPNTRITLKLQEMKSYLKDLNSFLPSRDTYLADVQSRRACEKTIQLAIESVIDILAIIVMKERLGPPTEEDSFINLIEEEELLSADVLLRIREMKGFRNILVHKYGTLDDGKAYNNIVKGRSDFDLFEAEIRHYLKV